MSGNVARAEKGVFHVGGLFYRGLLVNSRPWNRLQSLTPSAPPQTPPRLSFSLPQQLSPSQQHCFNKK